MERIYFSKADFNTWFDWYFSLFPFATNRPAPIIKASVITVFIIYIITLIISLLGGFFLLFIKSYLIYLVVFGILWVLVWLRWGEFRLFEVLNKFPYAEELNDKSQVKKSLDKILRLMSSNSFIAVMFIPLMLISVVLILARYNQIKLPYHFAVPSILGLSDEWFMPNALLLKETIIFIFAVVVVLLIATAGTQIFLYSTGIIRVLSNAIVYEIPPFFLSNLSPITTFSLEIAVSWYVGILLVIYATSSSVSASILLDIFLIVLFLVDIVVFLLPQITFHIAMENSKSKALNEFHEIYKNISINFNKISKENFESDINKISDLKNLIDIYDKIENSRTWIISNYQLIKLFVLLIPPFIIALHPFKENETLVFVVSLLLPVLFQ